jgi:hypothetical protein
MTSERRPAQARPSPKDPFGEGPSAARARRMRSLGIALALIGFIVIVFIVSIIKMSGGHGF